MSCSDNTVSQSWNTALHPPSAVPESADVVIIGGGIVGISTAWFLARRGIDVVVCEKGHIAGEQSGRNWGWVRAMVRDSRELPMMLESLRIWAGLEKEIGEDVGFERGGCMILAETHDYLNETAAWQSVGAEYGVETRVIEGPELDGVLQDASKHWVGALYCESDGRAEPHKATAAIGRAAERCGARILTACAARGIDAAGGSVTGVVTEYGTIRTSTVLCAAGAWTSMFCRSLGISLPQLKVQGTVARLGPAENIFNGNAYDKKLALRRRQDGGYTVAHGFELHHSITPSTLRYCLKFLPALKMEFSKLHIGIGGDFWNELKTPSQWPLDKASPFEKQRVLSPEPDPLELQRTRRKIDRLFPRLAPADIVESWSGMVEMTPDVIPVMCESERLRGFFMATGFSGHGFGIGPGAGKTAAGMLTATDTGIDLSEFRLERFFDGTPIRPQSSI